MMPPSRRAMRSRRRLPENGSGPCEVSQLIDVFDSTRSLEDQRIEARRDRSPELGAELLGASDDFLRIQKCPRV